MAAREGCPEAIRFNIQDTFCRVDLADDESDFNSDSNLESDEQPEASTDGAPDGDTNMVAGQASIKGNREAIVVDGLPMDEDASIGLFHS